MIDRKKTVKAWRARAGELYDKAAELRKRGDVSRAEQFEKAAAGYADDADALEARGS